LAVIDRSDNIFIFEAASIGGLFHDRRCALLFTDTQMPGGMDGLKLAHPVRERWPPLLWQAARGQEDDCRDAEYDRPRLKPPLTGRKQQ
jgi:hypothetical protein